jgi:regulator of nonsense transcripts 1
LFNPQVTHMAVPEGERLRKLLALRGAQGGLNASDEKELKSLRRRLEMEVLENADVVCTTCVGAGDPRLSHFRFQHVSRAPRS